MIRLRHKLFIYALRLFDQAVLVAALLICLDQFGIHQRTGPLSYLFRNYYDAKDGVGLAVIMLCWLWIFDNLVHYETNRLKTLKRQIFDVIKAYSATAFLLMVVATTFSFRRIHNELILVFWAATCSLGILGRIILSWFLMLVRRSGYNYRHLLILGCNEQALHMAEKIEATPVLGYKITGFVSELPVGQNPDWATKGDHRKIIGHIADLQAILEKGPIDEIMVCVPILTNFTLVNDAIKLAQELGVVVRLFPDQATTRLISRCNIEQFDGTTVITFFREQMLLQLFGKRVLDLVGSFLLLILLSPLLLIVAAAVKFSSPGPVLFIQPRVGMNKRSFNLYKFRSMYIDAEKRRQELAHLNEMDGPVFKIKNDPRITPLGHFIRKTSIDELPQLVNVLTGKISLVGPRPPLLDEVNRYEWLYRKRLSVKPGITCLWQISGRNEVTFKQWMEMDHYYIDNWSLWLDIKILAKTLPAVLFRRGAS